ncbi:MAG: LbtU family siderophore porin [Deltaproteobacteria bacterium]|nr:LbtU family siderophore porin [Deltaproteobacteria bacterium]
MKKIIIFAMLFLFVSVVQKDGRVLAEEIGRAEIMAELQILKQRMARLEEALAGLAETVPSTQQQTVSPDGSAKVATAPAAPVPVGRKPNPPTDNPEAQLLRQGERSVAEHLEALRKAGQGIEFSGTIEIEASYENYKAQHESGVASSHLDLATAELGVDAFLSPGVRAHIIFAYDKDEGVDLDEAMLHYQAIGVCQPDCTCNAHWFASLGLMKVPFGYYASHFITDPLTLTLGETREVAALAGLNGGPLMLAAGVYNGALDVEGREDHLDKFFAAAFLHLKEGLVPDLSGQVGISYISNIADSIELTDYFADEFAVDSLQARVGGCSAFLSLAFREIFSLEAEWVGALGHFKVDRRFAPKTWNLELAYRPLEALEIGLRYAGSRDGLNFLPEKQYGLVAAYEIFEKTSIGIEYLYEEYENQDRANRVTTQVGVEF